MVREQLVSCQPDRCSRSCLAGKHKVPPHERLALVVTLSSLLSQIVRPGRTSSPMMRSPLRQRGNFQFVNVLQRNTYTGGFKLIKGGGFVFLFPSGSK